jgi:drug/metabolite transporter (DMT)-like permease
MVAALREVSVLFAVLIGGLVLREVITPRRVLGALTIIGGIVALRLS